MFSYYGSKSKIVDYYPAPRFDTIIEPFAGSARYALKYWEHDIILVDKYDVIVKIWHWLQQASKEDILRLPELKQGQRINREMFDSDGEFLLMQYMVASSSHTGLSVSKWGTGQFEGNRIRFINLLDRIRKWKVICADYRTLENRQATWFIDPPYQYGGEHYKESNRKIDFQELAQWCQERQGQAIVCENTKADWLPFKPMVKLHGMQHVTTEAIWSNLPTNYDDQDNIPQLF